MEAAAAMEAGRKLAARHPHGRSRTAHNMSSSSLRKKSDAALVRKVPVAPLRPLLANLQEVFLATKLAVLFPAVPLAIAAQCFRFDQVNSIPHSIPFHVRFDHPLVCLVFVASFFFFIFFFSSSAFASGGDQVAGRCGAYFKFFFN
jgi:hypothetical protein